MKTFKKSIDELPGIGFCKRVLSNARYGKKNTK